MTIKLTIDIPNKIKYILNTLNINSYKAYIVGGCVRDSILCKTPKDWDIATDATPQVICNLFEKTIPTGLQHGTVTVLIDGTNIEVTTFRTDGNYSDNRRPDQVKFTSRIEDDLGRRDFTINSVAYNQNEGFIDPYGGIDDIDRMIIKTVGDPDMRFNEDALRILRAIRFSAELNFPIEENTLNSIRENGHLLKNISGERIRDELTKLLISVNPLKFSLLYDTGILKYLIPEFETCFNTPQNTKYHIYNVALHTLTAVSCIENDPILRWTMLLHDIGKPKARYTDESGIDHFHGHYFISENISLEILKRLKFDNKATDIILRLIRHHDIELKSDERSIRKTINTIGEDIFISLLKVKKADKMSQNPIFLEKGLETVNLAEQIYADIKQKNQCVSLKTLSINGLDLMKLGMNEGPQIGNMLKKLLEFVIDNPENNTKVILIEKAKTLIQIQEN